MMPTATTLLHARCDCGECLRARVTLCGLPMPRPSWTATVWCVVCLNLLHVRLAADECPRVHA